MSRLLLAFDLVPFRRLAYLPRSPFLQWVGAVWHRFLISLQAAAFERLGHVSLEVAETGVVVQERPQPQFSRLFQSESPVHGTSKKRDIGLCKPL